MSTPHVPPPLAAGRLSQAEYARNFADAHPPLTPVQALLEAERCYYCHDAPCTDGLPDRHRHPDLHRPHRRSTTCVVRRAPSWRRTCWVACAPASARPRCCASRPACAMHQEDKPVEIGLLQRHATDAYFAKPGRAAVHARAGHAASAWRWSAPGRPGWPARTGLAMLGHAVTLFDDKPKLGGLNEYGLATYKTVDGFAQKEIDWLLSIGGIEVRPKHSLGRDMHLDALARDYDAVFLGLGLAGVNTLGIAEPVDAAARAAVDFIAELRQAASPAEVAVGRRVVVIGGGMTAVDAAVQSRLLGAEDVTMVYRRGPEAMSASAHEQQWAQTNGVRIKHWGAPQQMLIADGRVLGVRFARTALQGDRLVETDERFDVEADMVLTAIGQSFEAQPLGRVADAARRAHRHRRRRPQLAPEDLGRRRLPPRRPRPDGRGGAHGKLAAIVHRRHPACLKENRHGRPEHHLRRHQEPEPLLAGQRAAHRQGIQRAPRLRGRLGRRGLEDAGRRRPADRQRQRPALREPAVGPAARHRLQQHRADHRPAAADQPGRDPPRQARLSRPRAGGVADGALRGRRVEGHPAEGRGHRLRRRGAELRLPARHERARHGLGRGPGAGVHRDGHALVQAIHQAAGDREAHAQHHRHPPPGARRACRRRRRGEPDQHHQLGDGREPAAPCA